MSESSHGLGSSLLVYGLYLAHEYYQELQEDGDDEEERDGGEEEGLVGKKIVSADMCAGYGARSHSQGERGWLLPQVEAYDGDGDKKDDKKDELKRKQFSTQSLFVVAFLGGSLMWTCVRLSVICVDRRYIAGSLDDLTLFVPMLVGQAFGWVQLCPSSSRNSFASRLEFHSHALLLSSSPGRVSSLRDNSRSVYLHHTMQTCGQLLGESAPSSDSPRLLHLPPHQGIQHELVSSIHAKDGWHDRVLFPTTHDANISSKKLLLNQSVHPTRRQ